MMAEMKMPQGDDRGAREAACGKTMITCGLLESFTQ